MTAFPSDLDEPTDDQRWSTWPAVPPSQRGPLPHPEWIVTAHAAVDTELGVLKTGKEADVFLIERAIPGQSGVVLAAKRYRSAEHRDFQRTGDYEAGRKLKKSRDERAVAKKSAYGRRVSSTKWAYAEFEALSRAWEARLPVPYPVQVDGTELLMEFIGSGRVAAPRLAQSGLTGEDLRSAFRQVVQILHGFAEAGLAHGDLSPYNLLDDGGRIVVIDLPQIVDLASNPLAMEFLHRDVINVTTWFARRGLETDPEALFADLLGTLYSQGAY